MLQTRSHSTPSLHLRQHPPPSSIARWRDRSLEADAYVTFSLKPDGSLEQMKMKPVSPLTDFSFDFQDLLFTPVPRAASPALSRDQR